MRCKKARKLPLCKKLFSLTTKTRPKVVNCQTLLRLQRPGLSFLQETSIPKTCIQYSASPHRRYPMRFHHSLPSATLGPRSPAREACTSGPKSELDTFGLQPVRTQNIAYHKSSAGLKAVNYYQATTCPHHLTLQYLGWEEKRHHLVNNQLPGTWC